MSFEAIEQQIADLSDEMYATPRFPVCARHKMLTAADTMTKLLAVARAADEFHYISSPDDLEDLVMVPKSLVDEIDKALTELKEGRE